MVSFIDIQIFPINGVFVIYTDFILKCTCNLLISGVFCVFYFCLFLFLEKGKWKRNCSPNKGNGSQGINGECIQFTVYNTPQQLKNYRSFSKTGTKRELKHDLFCVFKDGNQKERRNERKAKKAPDGNNGKSNHEWIQCHQLLKHNFTFFFNNRFIFYWSTRFAF